MQRIILILLGLTLMASATKFECTISQIVVFDGKEDKGRLFKSSKLGQSISVIITTGDITIQNITTPIVGYSNKDKAIKYTQTKEYVLYYLTKTKELITEIQPKGEPMMEVTHTCIKDIK